MKTSKFVNTEDAPTQHFDSGDCGSSTSLKRPPTQVGDYRIDGHISNGGAGRVFLASKNGTNDKFALKLYDESNTIVGQNEAKLLSKLSHHSIVKYKECGLYDDYQYCATEYIEGETLAKKIEKSPDGLPESDVGFIIRQLLQALEYTHEQGILHRDVTPSNVIVSGSNKITLIDFGLASSIQSAADGNLLNAIEYERTLTADSKYSYEGTPFFTAPEVVNGGRPITSSDLYSVGALAYFLLTGKKPVGQYKKVNSIRSDIVGAWDIWLESLLTAEPENRFKSAKVAHENLPNPTKIAAGALSESGSGSKSNFLRYAVIISLFVASVGAALYLSDKKQNQSASSNQNKLPLPEEASNDSKAPKFTEKPEDIEGNNTNSEEASKITPTSTTSENTPVLDPSDPELTDIVVPQPLENKPGESKSAPDSGASPWPLEPVSLFVTSNPYANIRIFSDGQAIKSSSTNSQGQFTTRLNKGTYRIEASKIDHRTASQTIDITGLEDRSLTLKLDPQTGYIDIRGTQGAEIEVLSNDNRLIFKQTLPTSAQFTSRLGVGTYRLNASLKGHKDIAMRGIKIMDSETTRVSLEMETKTGMITLKSAKGIRVSYVGPDGFKDLGALTSNTRILDLIPGNYNFSARRSIPGYNIVEQTVSIGPDERVELTLMPTLKDGEVNVTASPTANIQILNMDRSVAAEGTSGRFSPFKSALPPGNYRLLVSQSGYRTEERSFQISPDQKTKLEVTLSSPTTERTPPTEEKKKVIDPF